MEQQKDRAWSRRKNDDSQHASHRSHKMLEKLQANKAIQIDSHLDNHTRLQDLESHKLNFIENQK